MSATVVVTEDALIQEFMPAWDVMESHSIRVRAPAEVALHAACDLELLQSRIIRTIFTLREWVFGSRRKEQSGPRKLIPMLQTIGWAILAEIPGREVLLGTITCPWEPDVVFHALPPGEFTHFDDPGWVKLAVALRADPLDPNECVLRTETRVCATDPLARARFLRYWKIVRPGVVLIRRIALRMARQKANGR